MAHGSLFLQIALVKVIAVNTPKYVPTSVAIALDCIIACIIIARRLLPSYYRRASIFLWSQLGQRESSRHVHRTRALVLFITRTVFCGFFLLDFGKGMISSNVSDVLLNRSRQAYTDVLYVAVLEVYLAYDTMDSLKNLVVADLAVAYLWTALYVYAGVSTLRLIELIASFVIVEALVWFTAALLILSDRYLCNDISIPKQKLSSVVAVRFGHFILPQVLIHLSMKDHNQTLYARLTLLCSTLVGICHVLLPKFSVFNDTGPMFALVVQHPAWNEPSQVKRYFEDGIIPVSVLEVFESVRPDDVNGQIRELSSHVADDKGKIAALSYKHFLPFVLEDGFGERRRPVKISREDISLAVRILKKHGFTHVWTDFAQNARSDYRHRESATWFELGVAPYLEFEVVALWTKEQAKDSMWIRLEEMSGLLGKGLLRARENRRQEGLNLSLRAGILQLGARACIGELAGCRESYASDVDTISRKYGINLLNGLYGYGPWSVAKGEDFEDDFIYRSQVTLNILIPLHGLTQTNSVDASKDFEFFIDRGRRSDKGNNEPVEDLKRLLDRFRNLKVFSKPPPCEDGSLPSLANIQLLLECTSVVGQKFRSVYNVCLDGHGKVFLKTHQWLGERDIDVEGFREVDAQFWKLWFAESSDHWREVFVE